MDTSAPLPDWFNQIQHAPADNSSLHHETSASQFPYRYRLIWDPAIDTEAVCQWLSKVGQEISLCPLLRQNSLAGIELGCQSPVPRPGVLSDRIEWFDVCDTLPSLSGPGLLVMDMDSTAIEIECIDELAKMAGKGDEVAEVTERAMQGELDFEQSLRQRVAALKGADESIINALCQELPLMPGLEVMVKELQSHGWQIALASGGFTPFVNYLRDKLSLTAAFANELVVDDGKLTGEVTGTVVDAQYKASVLSRLGDEFAIPHRQQVAIGDGANDIPMIQAAALGIAFHAKPKLKAEACASIDNLDLRVLAYLLALKD